MNERRTGNGTQRVLESEKQRFVLAEITFIKPGTRFLTLLWFAHRYVCVPVCLSVCPPPRELVPSGVIWCDINHVRLVK